MNDYYDSDEETVTKQDTRPADARVDLMERIVELEEACSLTQERAKDAAAKASHVKGELDSARQALVKMLEQSGILPTEAAAQENTSPYRGQR